MSGTDPDELAIARTIDRMLLWARRKAPTHLSATSITTLDTLLFEGPVRVSDLATREGLSQPGMTTLVNRLAADGLAERFADPTDGRAILVRITDAGRDVLADRHRARAEAILADLRRLSPRHRADLAAALDALAELAGRPAEPLPTGAATPGNLPPGNPPPGNPPKNHESLTEERS